MIKALILSALSLCLLNLRGTLAHADEKQFITCGADKMMVTASSGWINNCPLAISLPEGSTPDSTLKWIYNLSASNHKNGKTQCVFVHTNHDYEGTNSQSLTKTCEF